MRECVVSASWGEFSSALLGFVKLLVRTVLKGGQFERQRCAFSGLDGNGEALRIPHRFARGGFQTRRGGRCQTCPYDPKKPCRFDGYGVS